MCFRGISCFSEWFFAYHLFGPGGSGRIDGRVWRISFGSAAGRASNAILSITAAAPASPTAGSNSCCTRIFRLSSTSASTRSPGESYDLIGFSTLLLQLHRQPQALLRGSSRRDFPTNRSWFGGRQRRRPQAGAAAIKGCDWIDYVVDGEGEEPLLALVRNLEKGDPYARIPGVSFRRGGEVVLGHASEKKFADMTRLPPPDHGDFFEQLGKTVNARNRVIEPAVTFEASRGCWWGEKQHCTFCGLNGQGMTFRAKTADAVLETIVGLHRKHRARRLQATDNILALDHLEELLPKLAAVRKEHGLDWVIFFEAKSNLAPRQMDALAAAGVTQMILGIESLSTPILKLMRKGVRAIQNVHALKMAQSRGMSVNWGLIYGFPGERADDYERMAALVPALSHLEPPGGPAPIRLDRFSPYHFDWRKLGTGRPIPHELYQFIFPAARFDLDDIAYFFEFQPSASESNGASKSSRPSSIGKASGPGISWRIRAAWTSSRSTTRALRASAAALNHSPRSCWNRRRRSCSIIAKISERSARSPRPRRLRDASCGEK